jgi:RNA polymerase sigma-70 factor (ECF subfamily)
MPTHVPADDEATTETFEQHRRRLTGLAYRMLGTLADAEDVVQEAWLRLAQVDAALIREPGAWLTTVTSRLCLDRLRSVRAVREVYVGPWLPEPVVQAEDGPAARVEVDESVGLALLVALERLTPEQRVALVLHDVFAVPFDEVARVLDGTPAAARQLATRARRALEQDGPPRPVAPGLQREVVDAFTAAAAGGDLARLVRLLAPDVVLRSDGGGRVRAALRPVVGADGVARFLLGLVERASGPVTVVPVLVNGEVGLVVVAGSPDGGPDRSVIVPHVGPGRVVTGVDIVRNPEKLARVPAELFDA